MRMVLLGLIGAGKGPQAKICAERRGLLHISTGAMLREALAQDTATQCSSVVRSSMEAAAHVDVTEPRAAHRPSRAPFRSSGADQLVIFWSSAGLLFQESLVEWGNVV